MVKRIKILVSYSYDENWIGGTYYIQNLILALNKIEDGLKPQLLIVTNKIEDYDSLRKLTNYPYIKATEFTLKQNLIIRVINKLNRVMFKKNLFKNKVPKFDLFFQTRPIIEFGDNRKVLYWIPDFQEHYFPEYFKEEELNFRKNFQLNLVKNGKNIVFSSENAKDDFNKFYPDNNLNQFVLSFTTTLPKFDPQISIKTVLKKYKLPSDYFICCNQFWVHKNHKTVLKAIYELKNRGILINVVFSGKEYDYRMPDYFNSIKIICKDFGIEEHVFFLGFIDRVDQLILIKNSMAVIQPSLFEGWSTVIEDAKALNAKIIASNIKVHQEQLISYKQKFLFEPLAAASLADFIIKKIDIADYNYEQSIVKFGNNFVNIISTIVNGD
jgi:glycosyltransferase involved in cell wall biosynthesis